MLTHTVLFVEKTTTQQLLCGVCVCGARTQTPVRT